MNLKTSHHKKSEELRPPRDDFSGDSSPVLYLIIKVLFAEYYYSLQMPSHLLTSSMLLSHDSTA